MADPQRFTFAFSPGAARLLRPFGIRSDTSEVVLDPDGLHARFGPFRVDTPWANVRDAQVTGPYRWYRALGARMSLKDRGATFGSTTAAGVCVRFHDPVAALFGRRRLHPGLTVTVADPAGFAAAVTVATGRSGGGTGTAD